MVLIQLLIHYQVGTSQPDILTMLHATKNSDYNLGDLEPSKMLHYRQVLTEQLKDYYFPGEAQKVSPLIPFFSYAWWSLNSKHTNDER